MSEQGGVDPVLKYTIHIDSVLSPESQQILEQLKQAKASGKNTASTSTTGPPSDEKQDAHVQAFKKFQQKSDEELKEEVLKTLNKLDSKGLATLSQFANNPTQATLNSLTRILSAAGPEAQILIAIIGIALSAPQIITDITKLLSQKGAPWNRDYRTYLRKQVYAGLTRELQKRKELGIDQVVLGQRGNKFTPNNTAWTYNSYFNINAQRLARIGLDDRAAGVIQ